MTKAINEKTITDATVSSTLQVLIFDNTGDVPIVHCSDAKKVTLDGDTHLVNQRDLRSVSMTDVTSIPSINPLTGEAVGTISVKQLYAMAYSLYIFMLNATDAGIEIDLTGFHEETPK